MTPRATSGVGAMPIPPCKRHHANKGAPCLWENFATGRGLYCDERIRRMLTLIEAKLRIARAARP